MKTFLILPHQLFEKKYIKKYKSSHKFILWEHPLYFTKYNYNKKRIILHKSSMLYYYDDLKNAGYDIKYIPFDSSIERVLTGENDIVIFDPIDKLSMPKRKYIMLESPNFLLTKNHYSEYRKKTNKFFFNAFYMWGKSQLNIIPDIKSQDEENREKLPKNKKSPELLSNKSDSKYVKLGIDYVKHKFDKNYGNTDNFVFPVTHKSARDWLNDFIKNKFDKFGPYQDAIDKDSSFLFHSVLSTSINIGLLNPSEIIERIMPYFSKIRLNSFEGYVRQLFWREYQRYCYIYYPKAFAGKNYFGNTKKLDKKWYPDGGGNLNIGVDPVDDCIKKAFDNGYLNHIERLMIVGNFMNLYGIRPSEGFRWFMEFSCDSYEWVMCQNVLDMVFFVSGGDTMRRPYVSSSNYILKMSNYKCNNKDKWCKIWDELYNKFLKDKKKKLWKFRYFFRGLK